MNSAAETSSEILPDQGSTAVRLPVAIDAAGGCGPDQAIAPANGGEISSVVCTLTGAVGLAATVEFLLLRLGLRMGAVFPHEGLIEHITAFALLIGSAALNFAAIGGTVLLFVLLVGRRDITYGPVSSGNTGILRPAGRTLSVLAAGWFMLLVALPLFHGVVSTAVRSNLVLVTAIAASVVVGRAWRLVRIVPLAQRFFLILSGAYILSVHFSAAAQGSTLLGRYATGGSVAPGVAEILLSVLMLLSPVVLRPRFRTDAVVIGACWAVFVTVLLYVNPWMIRTISVWTLGVTMLLPAPVYALISLFGAFTVVSLVLDGLRDRIRLVRGTGLLLLVAGGIQPGFSYLALLGVLGLMLLARSINSGDTPGE